MDKKLEMLGNQQPSPLNGEGSQTMHTPNRSFPELAKELMQSANSLDYGGKVMQKLADTFNIGLKTAYVRFHSIFNCSPREYIYKIKTITKEEASKFLFETSSVKEFWEVTKMPFKFRIGFFDRTFGVSSYQKAKVKVLSEKTIINRNITTEDNKAILTSQFLGDGWFDKKRHSLKIEHGYKQVDYLRFKVNLLCQGFPYLNPSVTIKENHRQINGQPYSSYSWYSKKILSKYYDEIIKATEPELMAMLTPIGWCLWYLDDGSLQINPEVKIELAIHDTNLRKAAQVELLTYNVHSWLSDKALCITTQESVVIFLQTFCLPFIDIIPKSMHYKILLEDIVEKITKKCN
jgi:LAGLIDADG DNA endonuclease family